MICTKRDQYMRDLINTDLMISWTADLSDGTTVYGDYDRPGFENPWIRLKKHCSSENLYITKIQLLMLGADRHVFFEDENGLDGVYVMRGMAKEQTMAGDHSQSYQTMTVCCLRKDCSVFDVSKYTWPYNDFEQKVSTRQVTVQGLEHCIFKNDSAKLQNEKLQEYLNGAGV